MNKTILILSVSAILSSLLAVGLLLPSLSSDANGTLVFYDDFEGKTLKWAQSPYGVVSLSDSYAFNGDQCMNLTAWTSCNQEALRMIGTPNGSLSRVTLDFWFSAPLSNFNYFCFGLEISSAHQDAAFCGAVYFPDGLYLDENDTWSQIPELENYYWDLTNTYDIWHKGQLVLSLETGGYESVTIDDKKVDLSGYYSHEKPRYFQGIIYPWFYVGATNGGPCAVLIDDVVLTLGDT